MDESEWLQGLVEKRFSKNSSFMCDIQKVAANREKKKKKSKTCLDEKGVIFRLSKQKVHKTSRSGT